jgi:hypothetical protein
VIDDLSTAYVVGENITSTNLMIFFNSFNLQILFWVYFLFPVIFEIFEALYVSIGLPRC